MTAQTAPIFTHDLGTIFDHDLGALFNRAVATARQNLPIKAAVVAPEYLDGYKIVRRENPNGTITFHAFDEDAWDRPSEAPLLAWSAPEGEVVATVDVDGNVSLA